LLRPATLADLPLLARHRRAMWEAMGTLAPGAPDASEANYARWLADGMASGAVVGWVAEGDQGSGLLWFQPWHPRPHIPQGTIPYLLSVFVEPAARGQGIARAIAEAAIAATQAAGHPRLALHASEAGRPVYAALGFRPGREMTLDVAKP
jgi:GNAT superfamily N-acetyltransferase